MRRFSSWFTDLTDDDGIGPIFFKREIFERASDTWIPINPVDAPQDDINLTTQTYLNLCRTPTPLIPVSTEINPPISRHSFSFVASWYTMGNQFLIGKHDQSVRYIIDMRYLHKNCQNTDDLKVVITFNKVTLYAGTVQLAYFDDKLKLIINH